MNTAQAVLVAGGSLMLLLAMIAAMIRANRSERRQMEHQREEWIAEGKVPEDEPNFYSGSGSD
jgi:uncharacterized protein (DUF305 family)